MFQASNCFGLSMKVSSRFPYFPGFRIFRPSFLLIRLATNPVLGSISMRMNSFSSLKPFTLRVETGLGQFQQKQDGKLCTPGVEATVPESGLSRYGWIRLGKLQPKAAPCPQRRALRPAE